MLVPSAALLAAAAFGCAHPDVAADKHFAELREQVSRMQAEQDKADQRLGSLEIAVADDRRARDERAAAAKGSEHAAAPARVVQLGGSGDADSEDPADPSARPEIRLSGPPGAASRGSRGKAARRDDVELPSIRSDAPRPSALDPDAKKAYESALAQVQNRQFDRGLEGLAAFLVRWPDHPYAENAMYWRGEAYYGKGEYLRAAEQFEAVLARFGGGAKGADALLKLGLCHDRLGASERAREYWDRLKNEYPKSEAAKRIPASGTRETSSKGPRESR